MASSGTRRMSGVRRKALDRRAALLLAVLVIWLPGCVGSARIGTPPRVDRLSMLTRGVSTRQDVLLALGQPRGDGALRSSTLGDARRIWFYQYVVAEGGRQDSMRLLIFFLDDRYDGHLWFSSILDVERTL